MFRNNLRFLIVLTIAALALAVAPACATTITTYNDLASWQAASSGVQWIDFENGSLTPNGAQFLGLSGSIAIQDTSVYSWMDFGTHKAAFINPNSTSTPGIRVVFSVPVTAFGLNIFSANPNALAFMISFLTTPYTIATGVTPTPTFFGATSDTPFSTIDISFSGGSHPGAYELIDNFRFGTSQVNQTPEAATFLLIGSGLVGMLALRKRIVQRGPRLTV